MHVDAFFEYLLNKAHVYWAQVPAVNEPLSEFGRDGVTAEEDLALRALLPEMRPKRGRRKAEDKEDDLDSGKSSNQRRRLDSPTLSEDFIVARNSLISNNATPATAHPGFGFGRLDPDRVDPWSTTDVRSNAFRWGTDSTQTPMTPYPQSAITPSNRTSQVWNDEPQSAITPNNKTRSRRRHGPAVSSAWTGSGSALSGKLRGRPPTNRSTIDGPFSTFPANPGNRGVPIINIRDNTPTVTPVVADTGIPQFFPADMTTANVINAVSQVGRPSRLQLQVPERQGGAVRLATPPPVVLVNGEHSTNMQQNSMTNPQHVLPMMQYFNTLGDQDPSFEHFVSIAFRQNEDTDRTNVDALESHFICEILAAEWYDVAGNNIERCSIDEASKICKQVVKNLQTESSSTEAFLINLSALAGGPLMTRLRMTRLDYETRIDYECQWKMRFGSIEGDFTIRTTVQRTPDTATVDPNMAAMSGDTEQTWKKRYLDLQQQIRERDEKVGKLKVGILDALVGTQKYATMI